MNQKPSTSAQHLPMTDHSTLMTSSVTSPVVHIVDDDPSFLRATSRWLRANGFAVQMFACASDFFSQRDPDAGGCLVVDLRMPGMDGLELQAALARTCNPLAVLFSHWTWRHRFQRPGDAQRR